MKKLEKKQKAQETLEFIAENTIRLVEHMTKEVIKPLIKKGVFTKNGNYDVDLVIELAYSFHPNISSYYGLIPKETILMGIKKGFRPYFTNELNYIIQNNLK
jgi:hypothetical protein